MDGEYYEGINWLDISEKPSKEQLEQEYQDYRNTYSYVDQRRQAYAEIGATMEALTVALWEQIIEDRPDSAIALQVLRQQVKTQFPKPLGV